MIRTGVGKVSGLTGTSKVTGLPVTFGTTFILLQGNVARQEVQEKTSENSSHTKR
jgi:hypothetical protein